MNRLLLTSLTAAALVALAGPVLAENSNTGSSTSSNTGVDASVSSDQNIYGSEIMTPEERAEFRSKMQSAKTVQERERLRVDHEAAMQSRAKQRGITLEENPSANQGPGSGTGSGSGDLR